MLTAVNKGIVEDVPQAIAKSDDDYYNSCIKSVRCKWLTEALYYEARGESDQGVIGVAYVILNRVKHPTLWPNTIAGVIKQKAQFSYRHDGSMKRGYAEKQQYVRVATIAAKVIEGGVANPVGEATLYHSSRMSKYPAWSYKANFIKRIGNHVFYK